MCRCGERNVSEIKAALNLLLLLSKVSARLLSCLVVARSH
jgi:hypothetical protein